MQGCGEGARLHLQPVNLFPLSLGRNRHRETDVFVSAFTRAVFYTMLYRFKDADKAKGNSTNTHIEI